MGRSVTLTAYMRNLHTIPLAADSLSHRRRPQTAADGCFLKEPRTTPDYPDRPNKCLSYVIPNLFLDFGKSKT